MSPKVLVFLAAMLLPALASGQQTTLVNCRTLEEAGNFIGSDEVLENNKVCQVVKAGTSSAAIAATKSQAMQPVRGETVSSAESMSVAEAARAKQKATVRLSVAPAAVAAPEKLESARKPELPATPNPVAAPPTRATEQVAPSPAVASGGPAALEPKEIIKAASASSEKVNETTAAPAPPPAPAAPVAVEPGKTEKSASAAPAPENAVSNGRTEPAVVFSNAVQPPAEAPREPEKPEPGPVAAVPAASASAEETPAVEVTTAESMFGRDPDPDRERVVEMGRFERPKEVAPDPRYAPPKNASHASEEDEFHEGQRPGCNKNVTLGGLKKEKLVLGTPQWAAKWIEKNEKRMPQTCFSDTPMAGVRNYLIVFYTIASETAAANTDLSAPAGTPASGVGGFTTSYGSTWHFAADRAVGVTVNSRIDADQPHAQPAQIRYAMLYTEEGIPLAEHWQEAAKKRPAGNSKNPKKARSALAAEESVADSLLSKLVEEIAKQ